MRVRNSSIPQALILTVEHVNVIEYRRSPPDFRERPIAGSFISVYRASFARLPTTHTIPLGFPARVEASFFYTVPCHETAFLSRLRLAPSSTHQPYPPTAILFDTRLALRRQSDSVSHGADSFE